MDVAILTFDKSEIHKLVSNVSVTVNSFSIGYHTRCLDLAERIR